MKVTVEILEAVRMSNAIEGVYDLRSFGEAVKAFDWLMSHAPEDIDEQAILDCHKLLMKNQPLEKKYKGRIRDIEVYIGGNPAQPAMLVEQTLHDWIKDVFPRVDSITSHVAFERIHPFVDGNGRIGRLLMFYRQIKDEGGLHDVPSDQDRRSYYAWFNGGWDI